MGRYRFLAWQCPRCQKLGYLSELADCRVYLVCKDDQVPMERFPEKDFIEPPTIKCEV